MQGLPKAVHPNGINRGVQEKGKEMNSNDLIDRMRLGMLIQRYGYDRAMRIAANSLDLIDLILKRKEKSPTAIGLENESEENIHDKQV
jgi:hypothetical protein